MSLSICLTLTHTVDSFFPQLFAIHTVLFCNCNLDIVVFVFQSIRCSLIIFFFVPQIGAHASGGGGGEICEQFCLLASLYLWCNTSITPRPGIHSLGLGWIRNLLGYLLFVYFLFFCNSLVRTASVFLFYCDDFVVLVAISHVAFMVCVCLLSLGLGRQW